MNLTLIELFHLVIFGSSLAWYSNSSCSQKNKCASKPSDHFHELKKEPMECLLLLLLNNTTRATTNITVLSFNPFCEIILQACPRCTQSQLKAIIEAFGIKPCFRSLLKDMNTSTWHSLIRLFNYQLKNSFDSPKHGRYSRYFSKPSFTDGLYSI